MQVKPLFSKLKNSMFMIVLFIIGIGIILAINLPKEKSEGNKKQTDKAKSSDVQMGGDSSDKVNDSGDKQEKGKDNQIAKKLEKASPDTIMHSGEVFDIEKLNNAVKLNEKFTTIVEIPFFNMVFPLPQGDTYRFLEKDAQVKLFGEQKDPNKEYIYTIRFIDEVVEVIDENGHISIHSGPKVSEIVKGKVIKNEVIVGFSTFNYKDDARQYLENRKNNLNDWEELYSPESGLPEFGEREFHGTKYYTLYTKLADGRYSSEYVTTYENYILYWKSVGTDPIQLSKLDMILDKTTITQPQ